MQIRYLFITIFLGLTLMSSGCYTVLLRPGDSINTADIADDELADDSGNNGYELIEDNYYYPYHIDNVRMPNAFMFYYGTAWWTDEFDAYEYNSDSGLPAPPSFGRRTSTSVGNSPMPGISSRGASAPAMAKPSNSNSDSGNENSDGNRRGQDNRRKSSRRSIGSDNQQNTNKVIKKKKN